MTRQRLQAQLRAARAIHDRAGELIIASRLRPSRCAVEGCRRERRPDSRLCEACFVAFLAVDRKPRVVMERWART